jgi:hypothetical protein
MGEKRTAYKLLVVKPEVRSPRHRWEDNTEMDHKEMIGGGLAEDQDGDQDGDGGQ